MVPILRGLVVMWRSARQRPTRSAKARSPRQRSPEQGVVGAVVHIQDLVAGGLFDRGVDALAGAFVATVGEGGQVQLGGGPVQGAGDVVVFGAGEIVQMSGCGVGGPER